MESTRELRWHGRAQQGIVTAAKILGETALHEGKHAQAFPEFGPERMGAPVKAFNRVSTETLKMHCQVTNPSIVLIADPTLIGMVLAGGMETSGDVTSGATEDAVFIVNSPKTPEKMRKELDIKSDKTKVYTVDASAISTEEIGRHMPNTPMLGALCKVTGIVELASLTGGFKENYASKYSEKVIAGNLKAMERGYEEVSGE